MVEELYKRDGIYCCVVCCLNRERGECMVQLDQIYDVIFVSMGCT